jgi:hypothetical protein
MPKYLEVPASRTLRRAPAHENELSAIRERYRQIWRTLRPGEAFYELSMVPQGEGKHVEFKDGEYRYIHTERGAYLDVKKSRDPDRIAYWMAIDLTLPVLRRIAGQRQWLERQADLLGRVDPAWRARRRRDIPRILTRSKG